MPIKGEIFDATPKSTFQIFSEPGVAYYVPPYQRPYRWGKDHIDRLFEDAGHGLAQLVRHEDAVTFIGTLILIKDVRHDTIEPHVKGELPKGVMLVIDGQQRISTLLLIASCLHEEIRQRAAKIAKSADALDQWLYTQSLEVASQLASVFELDMVHGSTRWYPRIVRAYNDRWSRQEQLATYTSPIASHIFQYGKHYRDGVKGSFSPTVDESLPESEQEKHEVVVKNRTYIRKDKLKAVAQGIEDVFPVIITEICQSAAIRDTLFNGSMPPDLDALLSHADRTAQAEMFRILTFSRYMLERVAVIEVAAKNEDYAFDMFESLNTTGEPLTAYETFRPRVVEAETLPKFEHSASRNALDTIEAFLDRYNDAQEKQRATSLMLIPFRLSETGEKLASRLSDQRRFLREAYAAYDLGEKRKFVFRMAHTAQLLNHAWDCGDATPSIPGAKFHDIERVQLCLTVLKDANHSITLGPMTRFYSDLRTASDDARSAAADRLEQMIFAMTAFFALWRGSRRGTQNIDAQYRSIMRSGFPAGSINPFAVCKRSEPIDADEFKHGLRHALRTEGRIESKEHWISLASDLPVYAVSSVLTRFLLLAASHDTVVTDEPFGCLKRGIDGSLPLLSCDQWKRNQTVEHIAPRKRRKEQWSDAMYQNPDLVDRLGNLTLIPPVENALLGNRPWKEKRLIYEILSAPSLDRLDVLLKEAEVQEIQLGVATKDILKDSKYYPLLRSIASMKNEWSVEAVSIRGKCLAELAWERLSPWLDL
jgi:hypothetical protein